MDFLFNFLPSLIVFMMFIVYGISGDNNEEKKTSRESFQGVATLKFQGVAP